ncbi:MAG: bifunctional 4-hydroxy-3-methylbut-2-enyl diphosphate reductase/30S ribosomal protein S1 [Syntrophomonadaceae bacterium]|nr:bifunctional 4-hydroxy-3-methylbut-2-enyl diphosphate reductase/30S ribosomal protein S1 [Syntrophomonadaceae bacterium]
MHIELAEHAGFCLGVKKAVALAEDCIQKQGIWYSLGPLVHNNNITEYLQKRGLKIVADIDDIKEDNAGVLIRSHGVGKGIIENIKARNFQIIDATCPRVKYIHELVMMLDKEKYDIVIFGDKNHPEIKGICGWCARKAYVVANTRELDDLQLSGKVALISQSTKDRNDLFTAAKALLDRVKELRFYNTICSSTHYRQVSSYQLAKKSDVMLVIGDKESSNTFTLSEECKKAGTRTYQIERAEEIDPGWFTGDETVGIAAGASTPDWIIKEVLNKMAQMDENEKGSQNKEQEQGTPIFQESNAQEEVRCDCGPDEGESLSSSCSCTEEVCGVSEETTTIKTGEAAEADNTSEATPDLAADENDSEEGLSSVAEKAGTFEENAAAEESFAKMEAEMADITSPGKGDILKGTVIQVLDDEVMVDVGGKSEGIIPLKELSLQEIDSAKDLVQIGDVLEVLVLKWDDDGNILLSKKRVDSQKYLDEMEAKFNNGETVEGTITGSVKGGLLVDVGITAFIPASHIDDSFVKNLDDYIGKTLQFKIIEFNRNKRRGSQLVLSRKEMLAEERARRKEEFWAGIKEDQIVTGRIKRIVDYGAFIDLGGYEGLLHVSEIDHHRIEHPSQVFTEGDEVEVYILNLDREKERVSLSRKKMLKSPWELLTEQYQEGDIIEGTVVRLTTFGAFVELAQGVDGLIHISKLADYRVEKPEEIVFIGEKVKTKILALNMEDRKISLSLKDAQAKEEQKQAQEFIERQDWENDDGGVSGNDNDTNNDNGDSGNGNDNGTNNDDGDSGSGNDDNGTNNDDGDSGNGNDDNGTINDDGESADEE